MKCYRFVNVEKAHHPVAMLCRVIEVSRSGFYAWLGRGPSARATQDAQLTGRIREIHQQSRRTYGVPRIHATLAAAGTRVGRKRVVRLMRAAGLSGLSGGPHRMRTTTVDDQAVPAPNTVLRDFSPALPNTLWVSDITYIPTLEGWLYLATELDCWSRKIVGWALADHLRTELPLAALRMAVQRRHPQAGQLTHHSDQGCQYTSHDFRAELGAHGIMASMSRRGDCYDNAVAESFFATLKAELVYREVWETRGDAAQAVFEYIEAFYNRQRIHSTLGYRTPEAFEREKGVVPGTRSSQPA